jgi:flagellar basal body-associated protein FliL
MNLLDKIEDLINQLLLKLIAFLKATLSSITPQFVIRLIERIKVWANKFKFLVKSKYLNFKFMCIEFVQKSKSFVLTKIEHLKNNQLKEKAISKIKSIVLVIKTSSLKDYFSFLNPIFTWIKNKINRITPIQFALSFVIFSLFSLGGMSIYFSSSNIYDHVSTDRSPASVQEQIQRPNYYKKTRRMHSIVNFDVPIYTSTKKNLRTITVDINFTSTNRYTSFYLSENEPLVRDYLMLTLEPISANFLLDEEGKMVLRDKIKFEINEFLKLQKVEGEIQNIELIYLFGT